MPLSAQALYMHLCMNADSDGFVNPKRIARMVGAANDDLLILIQKRFLLSFESGVVVIKHWWINNTKRMDRHAPTSYQNELAELYIKDNKAYTKDTTQMAIPTEVDNQSQLPMATNGQPFDNQRLPQSKAIQSNSKQFKAKQTKPDKPAESNSFDKKKLCKSCAA